MVEASIVNKKELKQSRQRDPNAEKDVKFVSGPAYISSVPPWSLAHELELKAGDKILEINAHKSNLLLTGAPTGILLLNA